MSELFEEFQEFRKILCACPCCNQFARVSDLRLIVKGPGTMTWLDSFEKQLLALSKKEMKFQEEEGELRELAREKGRKEAKKYVNKALSPSFKALKYDVDDVKPIFNPIDFLVFKGMNKKDQIDEIIMLSGKCNNAPLTTLRNQVKKAITKKNYDWQVARIGDLGGITFE